jgi:hypothetical protein
VQDYHKIRIRGTIDDNFWELNPEFNVIGEVNSFRRKIADDDKSSKIMWSLWLLYNYDSPFKTMNLSDRVIEISTNYLEDDLYKYENFSDWYYDNFKSKEEKMLDKWEKDLDDREKLFDSIPWTKNDLSVKEGMLKSRSALFEQYAKVKAAVHQQIIEKGNWGDYDESFVEKMLFDADSGEE